MKKSFAILALAIGLTQGVAAAAPHTYVVSVANEAPVTVVLDDTEGASVAVESDAKVGLAPASPAAQVRLYMADGKVWVRAAQRWLNNPWYVGLMGYYTLPVVESVETRLPLELTAFAGEGPRSEGLRPKIVIARLT